MSFQQLIASASDQPILTYWRIPRPNGQTLACTSYRTPTGLELRAGLEGDEPALQADVLSHAEAQQLAEVWRMQFAQAAAA